MFGGLGSGINANLTPFLTEEMLHPQGIGQQGLSAETAAATGGAGGALSAFQGMGAQRARPVITPEHFRPRDDASRNAMKAKAGASENIAAGNQNLMQQQQQEGAAGLGGLYKTDTSGMLGAMGQEAPDINAATNAANSGFWGSFKNGLGKGLGGGLAGGIMGALGG